MGGRTFIGLAGLDIAPMRPAGQDGLSRGDPPSSLADVGPRQDVPHDAFILDGVDAAGAVDDTSRGGEREREAEDGGLKASERGQPAGVRGVMRVGARRDP
jgi:hypothetical protein